MKWGLTRRGEYPEAIARELEQLAEAVRTAFAVAHTPEGRHQVVCARWNLASGQSLTSAATTRIVCTRPDPDNQTTGVVMGTDGVLTVQRTGVYQVLGQVRFDADATGVRVVGLYRRQTLIAQSVGPASATVSSRVQATETLWCEAGDTLELYGTQDSGGALNVSVDAGTTRQETFLRVVRLPS
jgi:hypothetical protein